MQGHDLVKFKWKFGTVMENKLNKCSEKFSSDHIHIMVLFSILHGWVLDELPGTIFIIVIQENYLRVAIKLD